MILTGGDILEGTKIRPNQDLQFTGGSIERIGRGLGSSDKDEVLNVTGCYVLPGFVDLHTHGIMEISLDQGSLVDYAQRQFSFGVTACVATYADTPDKMRKAFARALAETDRLRRTPNVVGLRPEIMYVAKTGAGNPESLVKISQRWTEQLWETAEGLIRIWDISPELQGAVEFVHWARERGIVTSIAHTSASAEQARRAIDAGASLVTHFYCTFDAPVMQDLGVFPAGLTDYLLVEDRVTLELIPDGVHVHPDLVEKTLRCAGLERVAFITDSTRGSGCRPGTYDGLIAGETVEVTADNGVRKLPDRILAGSALTQLKAFHNAVRIFGRSIADASVLCSRTPAEVLGLDRKGYLAPGMDADIVVLDRDLDLVMTICGGETAFSRDNADQAAGFAPCDTA